MIIVFIILVAVSGFHFIYESTILPSLRLKNRIRLFSLRDKLRRLKIVQPDLDEQAFSYVQESINGFCNRLHVIDIPFIIVCGEAINNDPLLKERVEKRNAKIESVNSPELKEIASEIQRTVKINALANNGAWFVYLTPLAMIFVGVGAFVGALKMITYVPEREFEKMPFGECAPSPA